jgi:hypothetical protein
MKLPSPGDLAPCEGGEWSSNRSGEFVARTLWHLVKSAGAGGSIALRTAATLLDSVNLIVRSAGSSGAGGDGAEMHAFLIRAGLTSDQCETYGDAFASDGIGLTELRALVSTEEGGKEVKDDFGVTSRALRLIKNALGEEQPEGKDDTCSEGGGDRDDQTGHLASLVDELVHALILACQNGHHDVVELLLDRGAGVGLALENGHTALMGACHGGHRDVAELLLDRGADVGQATQDGMTALMLACLKGHRDVAELLLDRGADVGQARQDGGTALMMACEKGHRDVAELLLDRGAVVGQAKQDGWTALV